MKPNTVLIRQIECDDSCSFPLSAPRRTSAWADSRKRASLVSCVGEPLKRAGLLRGRNMRNELLVCRVDAGDSMRDFVTLVPSEIFSSRGLVSEAIVGVLSRLLEDDERITPDVFTRNSVFVEFMHEVIVRHAPKDPTFQAEARRQGNGWIYIIDQRTPDPAGTVPPEDIVGSFQIANGKVIPESYQSNPKHLILSSKGFFDLGANLNGALVDEVLLCYSKG